MSNTAEIIDRLAAAMDAKDDTALAAKLGIPRTTVSSWRSRGKIPYDECVDVAGHNGFSLNWLILGEGPERRAPKETPIERSRQDEFREKRAHYLRAERLLEESRQRTSIDLPPGLMERVLEVAYLYGLDRDGVTLLLDFGREAIENGQLSVLPEAGKVKGKKEKAP